MQRCVIACTVALLLACNPGGPAVVIHTATKGPVRVRVELARTQEEQSHGLMYRSALPEDHGMLFLFPDETVHNFWMKNTLIPLDMIFIGADGRIAGIHAKATPLSEARITVGKPSKWVLEVNGGWAEYHGAAPGDRVGLEGATP